MNIYEMYGRAVEERHAEHEAHLNTIRLLDDLKAGRITLDRLSVNAATASWSVSPVQQEPPANGQKDPESRPAGDGPRNGEGKHEADFPHDVTRSLPAPRFG